MATSDSEDFESADEGENEITQEKKVRKKRLSSSNYSDSAQESDQEPKNTSLDTCKTKNPMNNIDESKDGWDDFDVVDEEPIVPTQIKEMPPKREQSKTIPQKMTNLNKEIKEGTSSKEKEVNKSQDTGWDDFDNWGQDDSLNDLRKDPSKPEEPIVPDIKSVADRLSATTIKEEAGGWGWGNWGVDSLLSTATAGISTLTTHVSQGITTVLETGIGAPNPAELARKNTAMQRQSEEKETNSERLHEKPTLATEEARAGENEASFPFGNLISGVTKFVESTGTKVIAGGLDTLETIGKKTMEVLQDGDPGLAKKRAMLGLDPGEKVVLSQVLREARAKADEEDRAREQKREAKEVHYETLFDDFEGLVHLEALEMLSKQVNMRIDERLRSVDVDKRQDIKETLQQVAELCEMPEDDDDDDEKPSGETTSKADAFHDRLQEATQDLGLKLQFQPLVKHYTTTLDWLSTTETTDKQVYKRAVGAMAQYTALCMELYHKTCEMLLVKTRRSTADEADALTQMTAVLTKHISELATGFTEKLNSLPAENKEQTNTYITNVFLEAGNSSTYIQNAFQLALPILQIGAV